MEYKKALHPLRTKGSLAVPPDFQPNTADTRGY